MLPLNQLFSDVIVSIYDLITTIEMTTNENMHVQVVYYKNITMMNFYWEDLPKGVARLQFFSPFK